MKQYCEKCKLVRNGVHDPEDLNNSSTIHIVSKQDLLDEADEIARECLPELTGKEALELAKNTLCCDKNKLFWAYLDQINSLMDDDND